MTAVNFAQPNTFSEKLYEIRPTKPFLPIQIQDNDTILTILSKSLFDSCQQTSKMSFFQVISFYQVLYNFVIFRLIFTFLIIIQCSQSRQWPFYNSCQLQNVIIYRFSQQLLLFLKFCTLNSFVFFFNIKLAAVFIKNSQSKKTKF